MAGRGEGGGGLKTDEMSIASSSSVDLLALI